MKGRTLFGAVLLAMAMLCLSGCLATDALREGSRWERIQSVLVSADGTSIAIVGAKHDYVFTNASELTACLGSDLHGLMEASIYDFHVDRENVVTGSLVLRIKTVDEIAEPKAVALGFTLDPHERWSREIRLEGKRYKRNTGVALHESQMLNRSYSVQVTEARHHALMALSPLTVAADGAIMLFAVPVTFLAWGIWGATQ
jgi:hypothetical protein